MKRDNGKRIYVTSQYVTVAVLLALVIVTGCRRSQNQEPASAKREQARVAADSQPAPHPEGEVTQLIDGEFGASPRWGSGWLDLATPTDFRKGDHLRIRVGGSATKILVRLLARGRSPEANTGLTGSAIPVPDSRIVDVVLRNDRRETIQISVHGGPNPWDIPLGGGNGPATIEEVELIRNAPE